MTPSMVDTHTGQAPRVYRGYIEFAPKLTAQPDAGNLGRCPSRYVRCYTEPACAAAMRIVNRV